MKKTIALILTVVMVLISVPMVAVSAEAAGTPSVYSGTPDTSWYTADVKAAKEFTITTADQLAGVALLVNLGESTTVDGTTTYEKQSFYDWKLKLATDVVINDWTKEELAAYAADATAIPAGKTAPKTWIPIGFNDSESGGQYNGTFRGTFDGQAHYVKGMYYNDGTMHNMGLFGLADGAVIQYVEIKDAYFHGNKNVSGLVGCSQGSGVAVNGAYVDATLVSEGGYSSGVVGYLYAKTTSVKDCVFTGSLTSSAGQRVQGIMGFDKTKTSITIKNCANYANITAKQKVGGITGVVQAINDLVLDTCLNAGKILSGNDVEYGTISSYTWAAAGANVTANAVYKDCVYVTGLCYRTHTSGDPTALGDQPFKNGNGANADGNIGWKFQRTKDDGTVETLASTSSDIANAAIVVNTLDELKGNTTSLTKAFAGWYFEEGQLPLPKGAAVAIGKIESNAILVRAVSSQASAAEDGKYNIRFIATIDKLDYEEFGFDISYTLPNQTEPTNVKQAVKVVYSEVYGVDAQFNLLTRKASAYSSNYLYTTTISDLPAEGTVVFTVKPYTKAANADAVYGVGYTVTYTNGAFVKATALD